MGIRVIKYLKYLFNCLLSIIYDENCGCVICGGGDESELLCKSCRNRIKECSNLSVIDKDGLQIKCYSYAYYSNIIKDMILRMKYKSDFKCGEALSELMLEVIEKNNLNFDSITFVPSSRKAMEKRGYNQSQFLAELISRKSEKAVVNSLKKTTETRDQIGLDSENRWKNLKDCFKVRNEKPIYNKKILLIDDVMTTGATAFYCARELINKGAGEIIILTVAKSRI
jgi:competence protein ComFC